MGALCGGVRMMVNWIREMAMANHNLIGFGSLSIKCWLSVRNIQTLQYEHSTCMNAAMNDSDYTNRPFFEK